MNQIASQPGITEIKRLHFVPTQIFNNSRKGEFRNKTRDLFIFSGFLFHLGKG